MAGYSKLFSSIIHSTVWRTDTHVRMVWITMLAMKDGQGDVMSSVPGLADAARVSREQLEDALRVLSAPDPDSANQDHEGRRILRLEGGWHVVSHYKYERILSEEDRKARQNEKKRRQREAAKTRGLSPDVPDVTKVTEVPPSAPASSPAPAPDPPVGPPAPSAPSPPSKSKRSLWPEDFRPNAKHAALATKHRVDLAEQLELCADHWRANGELKANWDATFSNWLRRANSFAPKGKPPVARTDEDNGW